MNNPFPTTDHAAEPDYDIAELLQRRANRISVEPDLDRVRQSALHQTGRQTDWQTDGREPITANLDPRRLRVLAMAAAALLLAVGLGATARYRNDAGNDIATSSLIGTATASAPLDGFRADSALQLGERELIVWMHPDASSDDIENMAETLDALAGVDRFVYVDTAATYEEFTNYYAEQPEVIELVEPEMLPTSFRVMSPDRDSLAELLSERMAELPGVSAIDIDWP